MWTFTTIRDYAGHPGEGAARLVTIVQRQPSWITRAAAGAAVLVFTGVVLLLVVPAIIVAAAVFAVLALANSARRSLRSAFGLGRSGRRNVRVITRR